MLDRQFGDAGNEVVIEEYLDGDELSILTFLRWRMYQISSTRTGSQTSI